MLTSLAAIMAELLPSQWCEGKDGGSGWIFNDEPFYAWRHYDGCHEPWLSKDQ